MVSAAKYRWYAVVCIVVVMVGVFQSAETPSKNTSLLDAAATWQQGKASSLFEEFDPASRELFYRRDQLVVEKLNVTSETDIWFILGWKPRLYAGPQLMSLFTVAEDNDADHQDAHIHPLVIVLVCPDEEDEVEAESLFREGGLPARPSLSFFTFRPLEANFVRIGTPSIQTMFRVGLLNGRYLLDAFATWLPPFHAAPRYGNTSVWYTSEAMRHLGVERPNAKLGFYASSKIIMLDPTRAIMCGTLHSINAFWAHAATRAEDREILMAPALSVTGKGSFSIEFKKLAAYVEELTAPNPSDALLMKEVAYSPSVIGGAAVTLARLMKALTMKLRLTHAGVSPEVVFTNVVRSFESKRSLRVSKVPTHARRLQSSCPSGAATLQEMESIHVEPVMSACHHFHNSAQLVTAVTYYSYCDPKPPSLSAPLKEMEVVEGSGVSDRKVSSVCTNLFPRNTLAVDVSNISRSHLLDALTSSAVTSEKTLPQFWSEWQPKSPTLPVNANKDQKDIVVAFATGYSVETLKPFVLSFARARRSETELVLITKGDDNNSLSSLLSTSSNASFVHFTSVDTLRRINQLADSATGGRKKYALQACPVVLSRLEVLRDIVEFGLPSLPSEDIRRVMIVDTRDAVFQRDPFVDVEIDVLPQFQSGSVSSFLLLPVERFFVGQFDFVFFGPFVLNRNWISSAFGPEFFNRLIHEPLTGDPRSSDGVPFPVLCGGLYVGDRNAVVDFLHLLVDTAIHLGGCRVNDQGLLVGVVAAALRQSAFPHKVLLGDPYLLPFTNIPRGGTEVYWETATPGHHRGIQIVNCRGKPYSVLHQFDRYKKVMEHFVKQL